MIFNLANNIVALIVIIVSYAVVFAETEPQPSNVGKSVFAVAKLNAMTKVIDGKTYQLVAVKYDSTVEAMITNSTSVFWVINGESDVGFVMAYGLTLTEIGITHGKALHDTTLVWMPLPAQGKIEFLVGLLKYPALPGEPKSPRDRLIKAGYVPFTVDASKIPTIQTDSAEDLSKQIAKVAQEQQQHQAGTSQPATQPTSRNR